MDVRFFEKWYGKSQEMSIHVVRRYPKVIPPTFKDTILACINPIYLQKLFSYMRVYYVMFKGSLEFILNSSGYMRGKFKFKIWPWLRFSITMAAT